MGSTASCTVIHNTVHNSKCMVLSCIYYPLYAFRFYSRVNGKSDVWSTQMEIINVVHSFLSSCDADMVSSLSE